VVPWELQMYGDAAVETAHTQVSLDEAVIACAIARHRLKTGSVPRALSELAPSFLARVPSDPITGQPYIYKTTANDQFVLYSPGWNQRDDGGESALSKQPGRVEEDIRQGDWVWKNPTR
jgi:hypothetical protein